MYQKLPQNDFTSLFKTANLNIAEYYYLITGVIFHALLANFCEISHMLLSNYHLLAFQFVEL